MKLTNEQKEMVEKNLNLVYHFCNKHNIYDEDFKQTLVCKFVSIIQKYNKEDSKLSTFVYNCLDNEYKMHLRYLNAVKRRTSLNPLSFQDKLDDSETMLIDIVSDTKNNIEDFTNSYYIVQVLNYCKQNTRERDFNIFLDWINGQSQKEISRKYNVSQPTVSKVVSKIQKMLRKEMM